MMNNLDDAERIQLIDISMEDDFLIDEKLDSSSFDLRLSVSLDASKEPLLDPKTRARIGMIDRVSKLVNEERDFNPRKSLAWDQSFFTSPGILEFEELCLVNSGFRNLEVSSSLGIQQDNVKGKIRQGRNLSHKPSIGAEGRQKTRSSMKTKVASPSQLGSTISSKRQQMNTERSEAFSGVVAKSHLVQSTSSRKEPLKSTRTIGQTSLSTMPAKKPPLRAINKKATAGLATNISADFSPYKTTPDNKQTASVAKSLDLQGKSVSESYSSGSAGSQKSGIKQSPLPSKASNLRMPSQKIGYFDMKFQKPETSRHDQDGTKHANAEQRKKGQPLIKKKAQSSESEGKENILDSHDTIIEHELKKDSPSPSQLAATGSPTSSSGQCSSSSKKSLTKIKHSIQQTMLSPIRGPKTPFLAKFSPLKKRSFF